MCRIAAYLGPQIPLERIVTLPKHSLLKQSQHANEAKLAVNGDGFGIAWYDQDEEPGLYRDVLPAWSDGNLTSLCRVVRSSLFLAHVRASTTGETSRTNCHPFACGKWSFAHNGQIGNYFEIRRELESRLPDDLFHRRRGSTDSELLFLLMLANGLEDDVANAVSKSLNDIESVQKSHGCSGEPNRITCAFSDGATIYAFRYSSDNHSPSLYMSQTLVSGGLAFASEPLDGNSEVWSKVREGDLVCLDSNGFAITPFNGDVGNGDQISPCDHAQVSGSPVQQPVN